MKKDKTAPGVKADVLTVFITGNELGAMKPCGCSGGQLGGLARRGEVFKTASKSARFFLDAGGLVQGDGEQDLIKFNVLIRALGLLGYDLVNLTGKDLEIAGNLGLIESMGADLKFISAPGVADANVPAWFSKRMTLKGKELRLIVASFDARSGRADRIGELFGATSDVQTLKILILTGCEFDKVESFVEKVASVDCVLCTSGPERPEIIGSAGRRPLVVSVGQLGKYVGKLEARPGKAGGPLKLSFSAIPVSEDLPEDEALVELYRSYQQILRGSGLLETAARFGLPGESRYMGAQACKACHEYEYEKWNEKKHAHAYATLEEVGSDYDPECVVCHVVGMRYESGFISPDKTPMFRDVGCESCHGPASQHVLSVGEKPTGEPKTTCEECHTPDNSTHYGGNEAEYFEKIVHWREPNTAGNVKVYKSTGGSKD
ncbi:MAG: hypothetical protein JXN61_14195 [Sedimentisphaerales bacterium]|nr:hypothetical protein [Sedimentisphaerales bacterium]